MALKDKLRKRIDGMKVEGDWRMKLAVYGGAILMVTFILMVMLLIFGQFNTGTPQVGTVTISSGGQEYTPLANQIYTTHKRERTESRRLVPSETTLPRCISTDGRITGTLLLPSMTRTAWCTPKPAARSSARRSREPTLCARSAIGAPSGRTSVWSTIFGLK